MWMFDNILKISVNFLVCDKGIMVLFLKEL